MMAVALAASAQAAPVGSCFWPKEYTAKAAENGALSSSGAITFNTTTLTMNGLSHGVRVTNESGNVVMALFPYISVDIQTGATVTVQGNRGLVIGATSTMVINADLTNGLSGVDGGDATGGTGGIGGEDGVTSTSYNSTNQTANRAKGGSGRGVAGKGYGGGVEPVANGEGSGGGYGGKGGDGLATGGPSYGDAALTNSYGGSGGSGGGSNLGGAGGGGGGGAIQLTASVIISLGSGVKIDATGGAGFTNYNCGGGGSGGAIMLCSPKVIQNGTLDARGGNGGKAAAGGGGGGRIAIYANIISGSAAYNVSAGTGGSPAATAGTYYTNAYPFPVTYSGAVITIR